LRNAQMISKAVGAMSFVLIAQFGCRGSSEAANEPPPIAPRRTQWSSLQIAKVAPIGPHWTSYFPARIAFDETRTSRIGPPLGGRITDVWVERGQTVATGAKLFAIASADLADLRNQRDKAAVELATSKANLDRITALVEARSLPGKDLVTAKSELVQAQLAVRIAGEKLASLRITSTGASSFEVTAPRAGVIVEKALSVGQQVSPSDGSLIAIADLADVWVVADLLDGAASDLAVGIHAQVQADGIVYDGKIAQIAAIVDPDRHTVPVRVQIANAGALRPGAHAELRFQIEHTTAIAVPDTAVLTDGVSSYVYIRQKGKLHRQPVIAAPPDNGIVAIREGLTTGDEVVTRGATLLDNELEGDAP
jgi:cobalt-zinc-cadmium efflux system membrane fusion protein